MVTTGPGAPWTVMPAGGYLNFDLVIDKAGEGYRARVVNSPGGEAETAFSAPFTPEDLDALAAQLDRSRGMRRITTPQLSVAKEMGGRLHRAVLCEEIRVSLARARDEAEREGVAGIRVRLHLEGAPELAVLPWELMFDPDPRVGRFLALAEETPLVRYVDLPERVRPLKVSPPLRVLAVVANPADDRYPELDVEKEWRSLEEALAQPIAEGRLELVRLPRATVSALQDMLARTDANILHFIGHGRFDQEHQDGLLAFEGERGGVNEVSAERLGTLLYNEKSLRLVVLNACEGGRASATDPYAGMAQTLVRMRVPAVVAMQFEITDRAAIVFARQFYKGIALGRPVDTAITDARMAIYQQVSEVEWATPVLYMRAPDGRIFDVAPVERPALTPEAVAPPGRARNAAKEREGAAAPSHATPRLAPLLVLVAAGTALLILGGGGAALLGAFVGPAPTTAVRAVAVATTASPTRATVTPLSPTPTASPTPTDSPTPTPTARPATAPIIVTVPPTPTPTPRVTWRLIVTDDGAGRGRIESASQPPQILVAPPTTGVTAIAQIDVGRAPQPLRIVNGFDALNDRIVVTWDGPMTCRDFRGGVVGPIVTGTPDIGTGGSSNGRRFTGAIQCELPAYSTAVERWFTVQFFATP